MTMTRHWRIGAAALLALCGAGCGAATATNAVVNSVVSPNPVVAQAPGDGGLQWVAAFTLTLNETAGLGATVTAANAVVYEASAGIITSTLAPEDVLIQVNATGNKIAANGSLPIEYRISYTAPNGGRAVLVKITVSVTDDNGASTSGFVNVNVT